MSDTQALPPIAIRTPDALLEALRIVGPTDGHVELWERAHRELDAYVEAALALVEVQSLAGVAHNGDPWYAQQERLDGDAILQRGRVALSRFEENP